MVNEYHRHIPYTLCACLLVFTTLPGQPGFAQEDKVQVIEEIITIGSRSQRPRSAVTSTAPIDVLSAEDFNRIGKRRRYYR